MKLNINNYPGGKNGSGISQWIINNIPEYETFYEIFGGGSTIVKNISTEVQTKEYVVYERSEQVFLQLKKDSRIVWIHGCGLEALEHLIKTGRTDIFVYADPPYLFETRRSQRAIYEYEWGEGMHLRFLELVKKAQFPILISHYDNDLYNTYLKGWKTDTMETMTRGGKAKEKIYMNYDITQSNLACTKYVGSNYIERQRINRRKRGYAKKFVSMPRHERQAILEYIQKSLYDPTAK